MEKVFRFRLPGITCVNCVSPVENILPTCKAISVSKVSTDIIEKIITIHVESDLPDEKIKKILSDEIEAVGVECEEISQVTSVVEASTDTFSFEEVMKVVIPPRVSPVVFSQTPKTINQRKKTVPWNLIKGIVSLVLGCSLFILMMMGVGIPAVGLFVITFVGALLVLGLGIRSYFDAIKKLVKAKTLTMDALFTLSTLAAIGVSIAALFVPGLSLLLDAAFLIFGFRYIGIVIEEAVKNNVTSGLSFVQRIPDKIEKIKNHQVDVDDVASVKVNDIIIVRRGEVIPLDGLCLESETFVNTVIYTGKPWVTHMYHGDSVLAGMRVGDEVDYIRLKVTATKEKSNLARMDEQIQQALTEKSPVEVKAMKVLHYFIPIVLLLAALLTICFLFFPPAVVIQCVIAVLVSACPCTLGLIVPLAVKVGIVKAADHGARFKSGASLHEASQIETVVFDLNGTLTTGEMRVSGIEILDKAYTENTILSFLEIIEKESKHPVAKELIRYANEKKTQCSLFNAVVTQRDFSYHAGVKAHIDDQSFVIGNQSMMSLCGISVDRLEMNAPHVIYLARNNQVIAMIGLQDTLRDDALSTIQELKKLKKQIHLCTGADKRTALFYADKLGIDNVNVAAECIPSEKNASEQKSKLGYIKELKKKYKVAMIGDAGNDAVSVAESDLGIAIQSKASDEMTRQNAGLVIEGASLLPVLTSFVVANETAKNSKQNLGLSLTYNLVVVALVVGLLLSIGFGLNPGIGVALMVVQALLVMLNVYRLKVSEMPHLALAKSQQTEKSECRNDYTTMAERLQKAPASRVIAPLIQPVIDPKDDLRPVETRSASNEVFPESNLSMRNTVVLGSGR